MNQKIETDVLILGGGPAGSAAAIRCRQAGLQVVILEQVPFPRHRPGETLHPGAEAILRELGVLEAVNQLNFLRHPGIHIDRNNRRDEDTELQAYGEDENGPWLGWQAWREDFDQLLLNQAISLGSTLYNDRPSTGCLFENDQLNGVTTPQGNITAKITIDATGSHRWLSRQLKLPTQQDSPQLTARYGYAKESSYPAEKLPMLRFTDHGWEWLAQVKPQLFHWARLSLNPENPTERGLPDYLKEPVGAEQGADVSWYQIEAEPNKGYLLTGDAAWRLDPAASHGILKSLMSGIYAAKTAECCINHPAIAAAASTEYSQWLNDWYQADKAILSASYSSIVVVNNWVNSQPENSHTNN